MLALESHDVRPLAMAQRFSPIRSPIVLRALLLVVVLVGTVALGSSVLRPAHVEALPPPECTVRCFYDATNSVCANTCYQGKLCTIDGVFVQKCGECGYTCPSTLVITNVSHGTPLSSQATVTWTTNLAATHVVKYGLSAGSLTQTAENPITASTNHSVTLTSLSPSTTYYYQAYSEAGSSQPASSSVRNFTTASTGGGSVPVFIFGPRADATDTYADITFRTDVATTAFVEYDRQDGQPVSSSSPTYSRVDDAVSSTDHTVRVTNFVPPSQNRRYFYRVTVTDSNGSTTSVSASFTTSSGSNDHVFTTGGCTDASGNQIAIGQCTVDRQYCRNGGVLARDCRPSIPCATACPSNSTCMQTGDCAPDPSLSGSPTECNQQFCYEKCDRNSGARTGTPCTADSDCQIGGSSGSCVTGSFNNPAVGGCHASWPACNANVILKVRPDRVCEKWLQCETALEVTDSAGKKESKCFNLSICDSLSPSGVCNDQLGGGQCEGDPLRFCTTDADCPGLGACKPQSGADHVPMTYRTPQDVSKIKNLSGLAYVGLDWTQYPGAPRIEGYYPLSFAQQIGQVLDVKNADFEDWILVGACSKVPTKDCQSDNDCDATAEGTCTLMSDKTRLLTQNWEPLTPSGSGTGNLASVILKTEGSTPDDANNFLLVTPNDRSGSGAQTTRSMNLMLTSGASYALTVRMKSSNQDGQLVQVAFLSGGGKQVLDESPTNGSDDPVKLATNWQTYRLGPVKAIGGSARLAFLSTVDGTPVPFGVDDIQITPALKVNGTTMLKQDCRLYPGEDSPKCDYADLNGIQYHGLHGYCLERDPSNAAVCLSWWPVDVITGDPSFNNENTTVGYNDRRPLYACAESMGLARSSNATLGKPGVATSPNVGYRYGSAHEIFNIVGKFTFTTTDQIFSHDINVIRHTDILASDPEYQLPESAIGAITLYGSGTNAGTGWPQEITFSADEFRNGSARDIWSGGANVSYRTRRFTDAAGNIIWSMTPSTDLCFDGDGHSDPGVQCVLLYIVFGPDGLLKYYQFDGADHTGDETESTAYDLILDVRELCAKLVRVAKDTEATAWADRTASSSTYVVPDLNYRYKTDLAPFAMASQWSNVLTPESWQNQLSAEGPDLSNSIAGQPRAGTPFACVGVCDQRVCDGLSGAAKVGERCIASSECQTTDSSGVLHQGTCVGVGQCLKITDQQGSYDPSSSKQACTADRTSAGTCPSGKTCCPAITGTTPVSYEVCVGGAATNRGVQDLGNPNTSFSAQRIRQLFAQSFGSWQWDNAVGHYVGSFTSDWQPPTTICKVCTPVSGTMLACTSSTSCGAGLTCETSDRHPELNAGAETAANYCAIPPRITKVFGGGNPALIDEGVPFRLQFTTKIDPEQLPLKRIRIDWGDGGIPEVFDNLRWEDHQSESNPVTLTHPYDCHDGDLDGACDPYTIRVEISDNWGWCSDTTGTMNCSDSTSTWAIGPIVQVKR